jgi:zinc transport system ATP-binding protein
MRRMAADHSHRPFAIAVDQLSFGYQGRENVLDHVSFRVCEGQMIGCIGPNGGGKTTLLRLLMGFLRPRTGKIELFGLTPCCARPHIAYVPQAQQHDRLFPVSVEDVVLMGLLRQLSWTGRFSKVQREQAHCALAQVGLEDCGRRCFGSLSGGQAQRCLIARALVSNPRLLFLDEPTASVDPAAEAQIYDLLQAMKGSRTVFLVTHDLQTAHRHVDRVLCVQGQVTEIRPSELCDHFALGLYHRVQAFGRQKEAP